jgi:hypothetical protein
MTGPGEQDAVTADAAALFLSFSRYRYNMIWANSQRTNRRTHVQQLNTQRVSVS